MPVTKVEAEVFFNYFRSSLENKIITIGNLSYWLTPGWSLKFDRYRKSAGRCHFDGSKIISLSVYYLKSEIVTLTDVIDTILHELAHAIAGGNNGHNAIWQYIAVLIGSSGNEFCYKNFAPAKYTLKCPLGCLHFRYHLVKKTYTERESGMATCPTHRDLPVIVINNDDNTIVKSFATKEDYNIVCQHFNLPTE